MDMMAAKVPAPKMQTRAIFSFVGRLRIPSVLIGNAKIHMSVTMLIPEVAALWCQYMSGVWGTVVGIFTVKECRCVDAEPRHHSCQIPHLLQRRTLTKCDSNADESEDDLESNSGVAAHAEAIRDGCISKKKN